LTAVTLVLTNCTTYDALPLPKSASLASSLSELHSSDGAAPARLKVADVAFLALNNNPDLRATRAQHGLAQAQILQAGIPPNPSLTGALLPLVAGPGTVTAYNVGISYNFKSLLTLSNRRRSAEAAAGQIDAQILWQEWQTVGQARLLAVDLIQADRSYRLVVEARDVLSKRVARAREAVASGNATFATLAPDVTALQALQVQAADLARLQLQRRHQLNALLGLMPDVVVPLADRPELPPYDSAAALANLPDIVRRRPDLVALEFGYASQDEKVRAAIVAQFPNLIIGITGGSDNSEVRNLGPQITLELPLFDRNQGNVAIERATRQKLHDEYAARLAATDAQVRAMVSEITLLTTQLDIAERDAVAIRRAAAAAATEFDDGNLDERSYIDLITARVAKELEILTLQQSLLDQQVAIATLLGAGMKPLRMSQSGEVVP
jgi:outer membrane protein TolC